MKVEKFEGRTNLKAKGKFQKINELSATVQSVQKKKVNTKEWKEEKLNKEIQNEKLEVNSHWIA